MPRIADRISRWLVAFTLAAAMAPAAIAAPACGRQRYEAAEAALAKAHDWRALHLLYRQFRPCDDGGLSEDVTEAIMRALVDRWANLPVLARTAQADPGFATFVLDHVDATADSDDLTRVQIHARRDCPVAARALCRRIGEAARRALKG